MDAGKEDVQGVTLPSAGDRRWVCNPGRGRSSDTEREKKRDGSK